MSAPRVVPKFNPDRRHPLLPSIQEVKELFEQKRSTPLAFLSDHLPVMMEHKTENSSIKVASWNIHAISQRASGYDAREAIQHITLRQKHIIDAITNMIEKHDIHFFMLQECHLLDPASEQKNIRYFTTALENRGLKWVEQDTDTKDLLIIYNPVIAEQTALRKETAELISKIKLEAETTQAENKKISEENKEIKRNNKEQKLNNPLKSKKAISYLQENLVLTTQILQFHLKETKEELTLCNVHWFHNDTPTEANEVIKLLLNKGKINIVGGDFNNRILSNDAFLVKNVAPIIFYDGKQGADYTDGFFAAHSSGKIVSGNTCVLNPETGEIYVTPKLSPQDFSLESREILLRQMPFVNITEEYDLSDKDVAAFLRNNEIKLTPTVNAFREIHFKIYLRDKNPLGVLLSKLPETKTHGNVMIYNAKKTTVKDYIIMVSNALKYSNMIIAKRAEAILKEQSDKLKMERKELEGSAEKIDLQLDVIKKKEEVIEIIHQALNRYKIFGFIPDSFSSLTKILTRTYHDLFKPDQHMFGLFQSTSEMEELLAKLCKLDSRFIPGEYFAPPSRIKSLEAKADAAPKP